MNKGELDASSPRCALLFTLSQPNVRFKGGHLLAKLPFHHHYFLMKCSLDTWFLKSEHQQTDHFIHFKTLLLAKLSTVSNIHCFSPPSLFFFFFFGNTKVLIIFNSLASPCPEPSTGGLLKKKKIEGKADDYSNLCPVTRKIRHTWLFVSEQAM